jgi:hypothetical protein
MTGKPLLRRRATLIRYGQNANEIVYQPNGGGGGKYRKKTTLPLEKVTPLDGYGNLGGMYDQSNGP